MQNSLQAREADQCLVGGINLMLTPHNCVYLSKVLLAHIYIVITNVNRVLL